MMMVPRPVMVVIARPVVMMVVSGPVMVVVARPIVMMVVPRPVVMMVLNLLHAVLRRERFP